MIKESNQEKELEIKPIWVSVSEAAKLAGVGDKTIRRAIDAATVTFRVVNNRYSIEVESLLEFLNSSTKLKNKLNKQGIGRYVELWKTKSNTQGK